MKKPLVIVLLMLLFPTAADIASAQEQPYAGDTIQRREVKMIPAYDPSDGFIVFFDGTIIKALMPGKSAKIWADEIPDPLWNGQYHQFKRLLSGVNVPDTEVISNDTLMGSAPPHPIVFGPDPEWWKFRERAKLRRYIRRLEKGNYIRVVKNKRINS